ncbi:MAG: hypothetical protein J5637_00060 [Prevotella sp.]|nr:hypothetical protein [Prevotella sp.]
MRKLLWVAPLVMALAFVGCAPHADDAAEVASRTAKLYYDALLEGKYDVFVAGLDHHLGDVGDYDSLLVANAKMYVDRQREAHQGIAAFEVTRVECDDSAHAANVFLEVHFADSTKERIVVPMVERDEVWFMR